MYLRVYPKRWNKLITFSSESNMSFSLRCQAPAVLLLLAAQRISCICWELLPYSLLSTWKCFLWERRWWVGVLATCLIFEFSSVPKVCKFCSLEFGSCIKDPVVWKVDYGEKFLLKLVIPQHPLISILPAETFRVWRLGQNVAIYYKIFLESVGSWTIHSCESFLALRQSTRPSCW